MKRDVVIAGGGPAGLALAVHAARRGMNVLVLERGELPADKACGEGLMPRGVRALEALGIGRELLEADCAPFRALRYVQEDGSSARAVLPDGGGLGIRRLALSSALLRAARNAGAEVRAQCAVRSFARDVHGIRVETDYERHDAEILIGADGLHSPVRRSAGLEGPRQVLRRFGLRRHFLIAPWSDEVEVHLSDGVEAYLTPCGRTRVGLAFLWEQGRARPPLEFDALLARFPLLEERLAGAEFDSQARGAGPFWQVARARVTDRLALLGDAAGYVDALTGEGVSLAFECAGLLAESLPAALSGNGEARHFAAYERGWARLFRRYEWLTRGMLALARRPALRRQVIRGLERHPRLFERLVRTGILPP